MEPAPLSSNPVGRIVAEKASPNSTALVVSGDILLASSSAARDSRDGRRIIGIGEECNPSLQTEMGDGLDVGILSCRDGSVCIEDGTSDLGGRCLRVPFALTPDDGGIGGVLSSSSLRSQTSPCSQWLGWYPIEENQPCYREGPGGQTCHDLAAFSKIGSLYYPCCISLCCDEAATADDGDFCFSEESGNFDFEPVVNTPYAEDERTVCTTREDCERAATEYWLTSTTAGDFPTKGCFMKAGMAFFSTGTIDEMSTTTLPGVQRRVWCGPRSISVPRPPTIAASESRKSAPCLTETDCRRAASGRDVRVGSFRTKGCFEKNGRVYFGKEGSNADMSRVDLPRAQSRLTCPPSAGAASSSVESDSANSDPGTTQVCTTESSCRNAANRSDEIETFRKVGGAGSGGARVTKGCFKKGSGAFWNGRGTAAEMAKSDLPGVQERIWCGRNGGRRDLERDMEFPEGTEADVAVPAVEHEKEPPSSGADHRSTSSKRGRLLVLLAAVSAGLSSSIVF